MKRDHTQNDNVLEKILKGKSSMIYLIPSINLMDVEKKGFCFNNCIIMTFNLQIVHCHFLIYFKGTEQTCEMQFSYSQAKKYFTRLYFKYLH